jgi:hypothetical protein
MNCCNLAGGNSGAEGRIGLIFLTGLKFNFLDIFLFLN